MIAKILIANRGEIAVRIIHTARNLGYRTVAVFSDADADALHVRTADEAAHIGATLASESYLSIRSVLAAAERTGADAIHPGYGFLSENAAFARACEAAGLTFIGPPAEAIELMGSKRQSKLAMIEAGVPCIPGYQGADQADETLMAKAAEIGFPLMVKASAGGGGRGMRLVYQLEDLAEQIKTARSEAQNAFGSGELILERAVIEPRHIEIQVFADTHGNVIYLGERDCSIQRRHQKVVEEAPSPFVDDELRRSMGEAAVNAARACQYQGAGTVEFLVDKDRNFYFLEMNTRLQVEHPVTEMITGQDLVAWQIAVADGEPLPITQDQVRINGHSMEVRLYAEDPRRNFMPQTGEIMEWRPPEREGVRIDAGIMAGQVVSPHYDPMLAKLISWGKTRDRARRRLASAVEDTVLLGVSSNRRFLGRVLQHQVFAQGEATTAFINQHLNGLLDEQEQIDRNNSFHAQRDVAGHSLALAALVLFLRQSKGPAVHRSGLKCYCFLLTCEPPPSGVVINDSGGIVVEIAEREGEFVVQMHGARFTFAMPSIELVEAAGKLPPNGSSEVGRLIFHEESVRKSAWFAFCPRRKKLFLDDEDGHVVITDQTLFRPEGTGAQGSGEIKAPMDGVIVSVLVNEGEEVEAGQTILVLEAMKMENALKADIDGVVYQMHASVGDQVKTKQLLAVVAA